MRPHLRSRAEFREPVGLPNFWNAPRVRPKLRPATGESSFHFHHAVGAHAVRHAVRHAALGGWGFTVGVPAAACLSPCWLYAPSMTGWSRMGSCLLETHATMLTVCATAPCSTTTAITRSAGSHASCTRPLSLRRWRRTLTGGLWAECLKLCWYCYARCTN